MIKRRKYIIVLFLIILSILLLAYKYISYKSANDCEVYINDVDGYKFKVPAGYSVDEDFYPYTVRFTSKDCCIEIYSERCININEVLSYVNYTNEAITANHVDYFDVKQIRHWGSTVLMWNRNKLSKIKDDKNFYLKIDIPRSNVVYTIFIKSSFQISDYKRYIDALTIIEPSSKEHISQKKRCASGREFNLETTEFYNNHFVNSDKIEWGIFQHNYMNSGELSDIEEKINHRFKLLLLYTQFDEVYDTTKIRDFLERAYSEERIVELTLQPKINHQDGNELFRVLDGYYDDFLNNYAKEVADFGHPVLFRFANEMNGDWCEYSGYRMSLDTELYRKMYCYIYDVFKENNVDNVIWIWNPNGKSFPDYKWNSEAMYYPGNEYVDVLGLTLYNTGDFYEGEKWTSFYDLYSPLYEKAISNYDMPFMITEFSCARKGGNKEEWTEKMLSEIEQFSNIKFAVWWNGADFTADGELARAYYINDSEEMYNIFKKHFS